MTLHDRIKEYSAQEMAEFIYGLCEGTEERIMEQLDRQGYEVSIIRIAPEIQIAENVSMLLQEVDDGDC